MLVFCDQVFVEAKNQERRPQEKESYDPFIFLMNYPRCFFLNVPYTSPLLSESPGLRTGREGTTALITAMGHMCFFWIQTERQNVVQARGTSSYRETFKLWDLGHLSWPVLKPLSTLGHIDILSMYHTEIHMLRNALFLQLTRGKCFLFRCSFLFLIGFVILECNTIYNSYTLLLTKIHWVLEIQSS